MKHQLNQLHKLIMPTGKKSDISYSCSKVYLSSGVLAGIKNRCWPMVAREARPRVARREVYKFAAPAAHNHDNWTIKFDLSLRHFRWTCPQIDNRLLNQNELWKSLRSFLAQRIRGKLVTVYIQISLRTGPPFWVKGPKNREKTEGASFTEVFLLFLTKESASRLPCTRPVT